MSNVLKANVFKKSAAGRLNKVLIALIIAGMAGTTAACRKPSSKPPAEILAKYQADALRLCGAIVACIKKDVSERLKNNPERRKMLMNRMSRDLCIKNQTNVIGRLSTDPSGKGFAYKPENYRLYAECSRAVAAAADCTERKRVHRTHASCSRLRTLYSSVR